MTSGSSLIANLSAVLEIGDDVYVGAGNDRPGKVAFIGETQFATGEWIGVILSSPSGKNDGTVNGVSYFKCEPMHGIFSRRQNLRPVRSVKSKELEHFVITPPGSSTGTSLPHFQHSNEHTAGSVTGVSHSNSPNIPSTPLTSSPAVPVLQLGERVCTSNGRIGTLRYLGPTDFAPGNWGGIELDEPTGKNNGTVGGRSYFTCKENHGLFIVGTKLTPLTLSSLSGNVLSKRSQESLHSHCSNLSSVSRSYRAQYGGNQPRTSTSALVTGTPSYRSSPKTSVTAGPASKNREPSSSVAVLRQLIQEKELHITQLLEERDAERSDLAAVNLEREKVEMEARGHHQTIVQLNEQLESMSNTLQQLRAEHERTLVNLHDERKHVEDLQFRMEEENIDKATLESSRVDDESRIFELEEALMAAREANDRTSLEVTRLREEVASLQSRLATATATGASAAESPQQTGDANGRPTSLLDNFTDDGLLRIPDGDDGELLQLSSSPDKQQQHRTPGQLSVTPLVSHASLQPQMDQQQQAVEMQQEIEQLRQQLIEKEAAAEAALRRQADVLQVVTGDREKEVGELNSQLGAAFRELLASKGESESARKQTEEVKADLQKEIDQLKLQLSEEGKKHEDNLIIWKNRVTDLTARLETDKTKWSQASMEQTMNTRKLEERLRQTEKQLMDYQESLHASAHQCTQKEVEQQSTAAASDHPALLTQLRDQEATLKSQLDDLAAVRAEHERTLAGQRVSEDRVQQLEASLTDLCNRLATADTRETELVRRLDEISASRDQLVAELSVLVGLLPETATGVDLVSGLKQQVTQLHQMASEAETYRRTLESRVQEMEEQKLCLEEELSQVQLSLAEVTKVSDAWRSNASDLETARDRMAKLESEVAAKMDELTARSTQLTVLQERLDRTIGEHAQLQRAHQDAVSVLEAEKLELLQRVEQAEQKGLATPKAAGSVLPDAPLGSGETVVDDDQSQVAFLNSIIVDLHKKNSELEKRVQCMLAVADVPPPPVAAPKKAPATPRLWCDECLIFDNHDTEKCPSRPQRIPQNGVPQFRLPKKKASLVVASQERTYCEICGVFDTHQTRDCTDAQTF